MLVKKILVLTETKIAFKTSLAASISLMIGLNYTRFLDRPDTLVSGLWCVMASIVVMQAHLGGTYKAAWARFLGVLIGSTTGSILVDLIGSGSISLGISVFFTIVLCSLMNIKDSFRIAGLSAAIVIIMGGLQPSINPWLFSFYRFLDSCIGILVAVIIARVLWPEKAIENTRKNSSKTLNLLSKYFRLSVELEVENQGHAALLQSLYTEIIRLLGENRDYSKEAEIELFDDVLLKEHWALIRDQLELIFESVDNLKNARKEILSKILDDGLANRLSDVVDKTDIAFQIVEKMILSDNPKPDASASNQEIGVLSDQEEAVQTQADDGSKDGTNLSPSLASARLNESLRHLNVELLRFRATRATRKFNLEDVESFFVFFYNLRSVAEVLMKMEWQIKRLSEMQ